MAASRRCKAAAPPSGLVIRAIGPPCDPAAAWHGCEPALTVVPDFLVTSVLAMALAAGVLIWAAAFVQRRHGGVVLLLLTVVLFLAGGGFTTPVVRDPGRDRRDPDRRTAQVWRAHLPPGLSRLLVLLWPWLLIVYLAWFAASWPIASFFSDFMTGRPSALRRGRSACSRRGGACGARSPPGRDRASPGCVAGTGTSG